MVLAEVAQQKRTRRQHLGAARRYEARLSDAAGSREWIRCHDAGNPFAWCIWKERILSYDVGDGLKVLLFDVPDVLQTPGFLAKWSAVQVVVHTQSAAEL